MQATVQHQQHTLSIRTTGKSLHCLTGEVQQLVRASGIQVGLCHLFVCHTSASLLIQENADSDVLRDLETFFARLVPENLSLYRHIAEGADDMPAHIRSALTQTSETIPIRAGQLVLGTWQGIYLWEHRQRGQLRRVVVHLTGC